MQEGGHHHDSTGVWVIDCDHLILIAVVLDNTLDQYVKWSAQEDVVCCVANDVELNVQCDVSDKDWHIAGEA